MNRLRDPISGLCATLCVVGLVYGVTATYFSRVLFDKTMFSNRVADCFADPHVSRVVAGQATDQILAMNRDLTPFRPIILAAVERAVTSEPFGALVKRAAMKLHPILITHGENLALTIQDLNSIVRTQLAMSPQLLAKLPPKSQLALGSAEGWPNGRLLMRVIRAGHRLQRHAILGLSLGMLLGVVGLRLSKRKFQYLLALGLWLAGTALLVAAAARFGGAIIAPMAKSQIGSDLARGLWSVFIGPLAIRMLVLAGVGFVLVSAATSILERIDLGAFIRSAWDRARPRPQNAAVAMLRGGLLLIGGVAVVFYPRVAVQVFTVATGAALFVVGIQEVLNTTIRLAGADEAHHGASGKKGGAFLPVAVAGVLVLLLAGGAIWLSRKDEGAGAAPSAIVACNGYSQLCDRRLNEVVFPTTHNSMSGADIPNWMFPNQERSIRPQLEDGIRGFLVDVHYGERVGDRVRTLLEDEGAARKKYEAVLGKEGIDAALRIRDRLVGNAEGAPEVYMGHGFCELGYTKFVDALTEMKDFLVENPNEVVIMVIQDEGVSPADVAKCFAESGLDEIVYRGPVTPPWPTLRELVERDERVVVFAENNSAGVPWYHQAFETIQETPYGFHHPEDFSNKPNRGGTGGSLLLMNHWIETAPASLPSNAAIVNEYDFLLKRARACRRARGMTPNLIAVDFYRTGDLFRVARTMNGIPEVLGPPKP